MSDTPGKVTDSVKVEARQLAAAGKKRWPSTHPVKVKGGTYTGKCCVAKK